MQTTDIPDINKLTPPSILDLSDDWQENWQEIYWSEYAASAEWSFLIDGQETGAELGAIIDEHGERFLNYIASLFNEGIVSLVLPQPKSDRLVGSEGPVARKRTLARCTQY